MKHPMSTNELPSPAIFRPLQTPPRLPPRFATVSRPCILNWCVAHWPRHVAQTSVALLVCRSNVHTPLHRSVGNFVSILSRWLAISYNQLSITFQPIQVAQLYIAAISWPIHLVHYVLKVMMIRYDEQYFHAPQSWRVASLIAARKPKENGDSNEENLKQKI